MCVRVVAVVGRVVDVVDVGFVSVVGVGHAERWISTLL